MEIDAKYTALCAVYMEYQRDIPDMVELTPEMLQMDFRMFVSAFLKLQNERLIDGVKTFPPNAHAEPRALILEGVMPTVNGISQIEAKFGIDPSGTGREKLQHLQAKFTEQGLSVLHGIAAEMLR